MDTHGNVDTNRVPSSNAKKVFHDVQLKEKSIAWKHFHRDEDGQQAKCLKCQKILKHKGSTGCLFIHLRTKHPESLAGTTKAEKLPQTTNSSSGSGQKSLTSFVISTRKESLKLTVARMCAKDGIPFSVFCTSSDLRKALHALRFNDVLPSSPNGIKSMVMEFANEVRSMNIEEIGKQKSENCKFSLEFDEWTSMRIRRYMNIYVFGKQRKAWNLGLVAIRNSLTSEAVLETLTQRLSEYGLRLSNDIVSTVTDGPNVMLKFGRLSPAHHQLCLAHGIQLAILDVLYPTKKKSNPNDEGSSEDLGTESESESDEEDSTDVNTEGDIFTQHDSKCDISHQNFKPIIDKCRKLNKRFKLSPLNSEILAMHSKTDTGSELGLIRDSKTRWSSLCSMVERFIKIKTSIQKTLIDMNSEIVFEEWEFSGLENLALALGPIKLAVEAICRRDANLLTADSAINFVLEQLDDLNTGISLELAESLRKRIPERRTEYSGLLQYLHLGSMETGHLDEIFSMPSRKQLLKLLKELIERLHSQEREVDQSMDETGNGEECIVLNKTEMDKESPVPSKKRRTDLEARLDKALDDIQSRAHKTKTIEKDLTSTIRKEMAMFEAGGNRGLHLEMAYQYLKIIPPTSVESERAFSSAGYFCNKIRSRLGDNTLDKLCMLRSYFQLQEFDSARSHHYS